MGTKWNNFWYGEQALPNTAQVRVDEDGEPSPAILPPSRSLVGIGPKEAYKIGTVYRSINIISTMISQMDLVVYRNDKLVNTPLLIKNPIESETQRSFVQQVIWSLALWGNAYVRTFGDPVSSVEVLDPDAVTVTKDPDTGVTKIYVNGKQAKNIKHLKFESMPGATYGHGPLSGCEGELKAAYLLDKFQQTWFNTDGIPTGVLTTQATLNPDTSKKLVEAWNEFLRDNRKTAILPSGMTYETLAAKPIEVQYIEVAEANIRNIARIFGIPAMNLLATIEGSSMTYTNYIEANIQFLQNTLSNYMNAIEDFLSDLLPRSSKVKFNEEQLLRMAPEKLWAVRKVQADVGYFSGEELRKEEGKPALPKPAIPAVKENPIKDDQESDN